MSSPSFMGRIKISAQGIQRLIAFAAAGFLWSNVASSAPETGKNSKVDESIFTNDLVLELEIEIPEQGLATLRQYQWSPRAKPSDRIPVHATVREGAAVYTNVAVHLKGAAGSFRPVDDKPGLTLNFDKFGKGQRFHGLEKISLNNSVQDPAYITDKLSRELFEKAGVPVPRAGYAIVKLNDRALGLYVLTEGWNKQFLKRYFKNTKGNLYDCGFVQDINGSLIVNSGENPDDHSDLKVLIAAARERDLAKRLVRLEKTLDVDRFITLLALDALLWNWDGYALNHNNYRVFHDLDSGRFVFFPHGMDQMFWKPEGPIMPGGKGLVAVSVMQIPECRHRYLDRVSELMTNVCRLETLTNRVSQLAAKLRLAQTEPASWGSAMRRIFRPNPVNDLMGRIVERRKSLDEQLRGIKTMLVFDPSGTARPTGWKERTDSGRLIFKETKGQRPLLLLSAQEGRAAGAWCTTVWLEEGRYRVTGKVRAQGVAANGRLTRSGVGFRVFSHRKLSTGVVWDWFPYRESNDFENRGELDSDRSDAPNKRLSATTDWVELSYDFDLRQPAADLEISCELRANQGEAWFDLDSLRIVRLNNHE
jgi:hypothetical protein